MDAYKPTPAHYFITLLESMGMLSINMTQNIDNLESKSGLNVKDKLVQAHGSVSGAKCSKCSKTMDEDVLKQKIKSVDVYYCSDESCKGPVKPDIVLFGESLPKEFFHKSALIAQCDLVIVMGTALAVAPFNSLSESAPKNVPKVLINRENTKKYSGIDFEKTPNRLFLQGDCDDVVLKLIKDCEWQVKYD